MKKNLLAFLVLFLATLPLRAIIWDPASIYLQPASRTNVAGTTVYFIVAVSGVGQFQWYKAGVPMIDSGHVSGGGMNILKIQNVQPGDAGNYYLVITNGNQIITSSVATLTVTNDPLMITQPANLAMNVPIVTNLNWCTSNLNFTELILDGGFESGMGSDGGYWSGSLTNWPWDDDIFFINDGTISDTAMRGGPDGLLFKPDGPFQPYEGGYYAAGFFGPGIQSYIYQTISIPADASLTTMSWAYRIRNFSTTFSTNRQVQVRILSTNNFVLATPFVTIPAAPLLGDWVQTNCDLSAFAGQTVQVEFWINTDIDDMDVYLDNVSVKTIWPATDIVTNDVYFGTNPTPGPAEFQGSTTNYAWTLPPLAPQTTYYWQIVAHHGTNTTSGPVWQFKTLALLPPQSFSGSVAGGGLQLQFSGTPNYPYILQTAADLTPPVNWQSILTNSTDGNGNWSFTVTNLLDVPTGYYRIIGQ